MTFFAIPERLPLLGPRVLRVYRALWVVTFVAAVFSSFYGQISDERALQQRAAIGHRVGLSIGYPPDGVYVSPFGEEARRAGIVPRMRLRAIDGVPAGTDRAEVLAALDGPDYSRVRLTVAKDEAVRDITLVRDSQHVTRVYAGSILTFAGRRWTMLALAMITSASAILVAFLLFVRRARDPVAALLSFGLLLSCVILERIMPSVPEPARFALFITDWAVLLAGGIAFPDGRIMRRYALWTLALFAVAVVAACASWYSPIGAIIVNVALGCCLIPVLVSMLVRYRRLPPGIARQQIKLIFLGVAIRIPSAVIASVLMWLDTGEQSELVHAWLALGSQLIFLFGQLAITLSLLVVLLRYRLYDADALISRSAAYAALTLLLGAAFTGSEKVIEVIGEESFGESFRALSAGGAAAIAATLIAPLHHRIHHWAEARFQRGLVALRHDLPKHVGDMREYAGLDTLLATIAARVERGVRAQHLAILLAGEDGLALARAYDVVPDAVADWQRGWQPPTGITLDCERDDPAFPIRVALASDGAGTIGWLLLGPRPDGSFYGKDERAALVEIADPIARAIHIVRQRELRSAEMERRLARIEAALMGAPSGLATR